MGSGWLGRPEEEEWVREAINGSRLSFALTCCDFVLARVCEMSMTQGADSSVGQDCDASQGA